MRQTGIFYNYSMIPSIIRCTVKKLIFPARESSISDMCEGEAGGKSIRKPAERRIHCAEEEKIAQFLVHPKNVSVGAILRSLQ